MRRKSSPIDSACAGDIRRPGSDSRGEGYAGGKDGFVGSSGEELVEEGEDSESEGEESGPSRPRMYFIYSLCCYFLLGAQSFGSGFHLFFRLPFFWDVGGRTMTSCVGLQPEKTDM